MRQFDNFELKRRVNEALYYVWDPIGVCDEPFARSEYDGYVLQVLGVVEANDDIKTISEHLANIIRSDMGIIPDKTRCDYPAEILLKHKEAIKEGCA